MKNLAGEALEARQLWTVRAAELARGGNQRLGCKDMTVACVDDPVAGCFVPAGLGDFCTKANMPFKAMFSRALREVVQYVGLVCEFVRPVGAQFERK